MELTMGNFVELNEQELFAVNGGDKIKQQMIDEWKKNRKTPVPDNTAQAIQAQATVTGFELSMLGVGLAIPSGGIGLVVAIASLVCSTIGLGSL